jgi:hypothetical protein
MEPGMKLKPFTVAAAVFWLILFSSNILFGDDPCPWRVYQVTGDSPGEQTDAVVYFEDCNHMDVIGLLKDLKTAVKLKCPIPDQIIIEDTTFTYRLSPDDSGIRPTLILHKPAISGQILLKKPGLCLSLKKSH